MMSHREAARQALADARLEGFEPTEEEMQLWEDYADEKISGEEYRRISIERAREYDKIVQQRVAQIK
ncbi:MAG: hypothetical protein LBU43_02070 [Candidatus Accumulibacter sp.]|jgi:hypothetical protein|nr:hypothetical protein [Accumulibacter sp.]